MNARLLIPTFFCPKAWAGMPGDEVTRFCSYCQKNVHNLGAMSVSERLSLLASPAASICARYKIAIRRPAPGKRESYMRRLAKYGAGVALGSSALLVLCEMYAEAEKRTYYRAFGGKLPAGYACQLGWPETEGSDDWVEQEVEILGIHTAVPDPIRTMISHLGTQAPSPHHIDLDLDPVEIEKLLQPAEPLSLEFKDPVPARKKKIRQARS